MSFKNLGLSFAARYAASRANGGDRRKAFRRAGIGSLTANSNLPETEDFVVGLVEDLAVSKTEERYALEIPEMTGRPNVDEYSAARGEANVVILLDEDEYSTIDDELTEFIDELVTGQARLRKLRKENRDK